MKFPTASLGELCGILSGFAFKSELFNDSDGMPVIRIRDVVRGFSETRYSGDFDEGFIVQNGEIIIGMDGNFNAARWNSAPALLNQRVCRIKAQEGILDDGYLFHFLPKALKKIEDATPFVTVKHLSVKNIRELDIPLPPLPEQRRIAAILDQADALRAKRREALAQLDGLTQSIFIEMFGDLVTNPKRWVRQTLGEITLKITDGEHLNPMFSPIGMPIIMAGNVLEDSVDIASAKRVEAGLGKGFRKKCNPEIDDLLVVSRGATIGRMCAVGSTDEFCLMGSVILIKVVKDRVNSIFLSALLKHPVMRSALYKTSGSSAQQAIYLKDLKNLSCIVPPIDAQIRFSEQVAAIDKIKAVHRASLSEMDMLFASLQHRAFRGEL